MSRHRRTFSSRLLRLCGGAALGACVYSRWSVSAGRTVPAPPCNAHGGGEDCLRRDTILRKVAVNADKTYDVCVIGGGVVGLYTAVDAAQRGLSVLLAEASDFGSSGNNASLGFLPGGFAHCQRALKQRDVAFLWDALDAMRDITVWGNVAPTCVRPIHTILPAPHRTEALELRIAASMTSLLSTLVGPWRVGHRLGRREIEDVCGTAADGTLHHAVKVEDASVDVRRVVQGLATVGRQLGVHSLNHLAVTGIQTVAAAPATASSGGVVEAVEGLASDCPREYLIALEDQAPRRNNGGGSPIMQVRARSIVNCTGASLDSVRALDQIPAGAPKSLVSQCLAYAYFLVPRDALLVCGVPGTTGAATNATPLQLFPSAAGDDNGRPLLAILSSATLRAFSSVSILPHGPHAFLIGATTAPTGAAGPTYIRHEGRQSSTTAHSTASTAGLEHQQFDMFRAIAHQLQSSLGITVQRVSSCMTVTTPLLASPASIGHRTANKIVNQGFAIIASSDPLDNDSAESLPPPPVDTVVAPWSSSPSVGDGTGGMFHVVGGAVGNSRRVAQAAVDRVVVRLFGPTAPRSTHRCRTEHLQIVPPPTTTDNASIPEDAKEQHADTIRQMVRRAFAVTVVDVIARRTDAAWMDPCGTLKVVPAVAAILRQEHGWTAAQELDQVQQATRFLQGTMVRGGDDP